MANFFPRWANWLPLKIMICGIVIVTALVGATWYYDTPKYTRVGYMPVQPVPQSRDLFRTQFHRRALQCARHTGLHELPHPGSKRKSEA